MNDERDSCTTLGIAAAEFGLGVGSLATVMVGWCGSCGHGVTESE